MYPTIVDCIDIRYISKPAISSCYFVQLLESYRSLTLKYMADAFGVTEDYMDTELCRWTESWKRGFGSGSGIFYLLDLAPDLGVTNFTFPGTETLVRSKKALKIHYFKDWLIGNCWPWTLKYVTCVQVTKIPNHETLQLNYTLFFNFLYIQRVGIVFGSRSVLRSFLHLNVTCTWFP